MYVLEYVPRLLSLQQFTGFLETLDNLNSSWLRATIFRLILLKIPCYAEMLDLTSELAFKVISGSERPCVKSADWDIECILG